MPHSCYDCVHFDGEAHNRLPYPYDFYQCDSTNMKVHCHIDDLELVGAEITPENVGRNCPGFVSVDVDRFDGTNEVSFDDVEEDY